MVNSTLALMGSSALSPGFSWRMWYSVEPARTTYSWQRRSRLFFPREPLEPQETEFSETRVPFWGASAARAKVPRETTAANRSNAFFMAAPRWPGFRFADDFTANRSLGNRGRRRSCPLLHVLL